MPESSGPSVDPSYLMFHSFIISWNACFFTYNVRSPWLTVHLTVTLSVLAVSYDLSMESPVKIVDKLQTEAKMHSLSGWCVHTAIWGNTIGRRVMLSACRAAWDDLTSRDLSDASTADVGCTTQSIINFRPIVFLSQHKVWQICTIRLLPTFVNMQFGWNFHIFK